MFDSVTIAEYMISLAFEKRIVLNMTKIQKLLYMAYGYFLAKGNRISKESPKAWPFGPVFPRVHNKVKLGVVKPLTDPSFAEIKTNEAITEKLQQIIEKYSKFSATQLSDWSHIENGPWHKTTKQEGFNWGVTEIPDQYIIEYFSTLSL